MGKSNVITLKLDVGELAKNSGKPINHVKETLQKFFDIGVVNHYSADFEGKRLIASVEFKDFNAKQYNTLAENAVLSAVANQKREIANNRMIANTLNKLNNKSTN